MEYAGEGRGHKGMNRERKKKEFHYKRPWDLRGAGLTDSKRRDTVFGVLKRSGR